MNVQSTPRTPDRRVSKKVRPAKKTAEPELDPKDFGGKLRRARIGRGVSLENIAEASKIAISVLEELERNEISHVPQGVLGRGFIRSFATEVGLNPEATVAEFVARFPTESVTAGYQTLEQQVEAEQIEDKRRRSLPSLGRWAASSLARWSRPSPLLLGLAAGVVLLAACPVYLIRKERSRTHVTARNTPGATKSKAGARALAAAPSVVGTAAAGETMTSAVTSTESARAASKPALPPESSATTVERPTQKPAVERAAPETAALGRSTPQKPAIEKPPIDKPVVEKPAVEKLVAEKRATEKPAVEKPPAGKPAAESLQTEKHAKPPMENSAAEKPAIEEPATERPAIEKPEAARARLAVVVSVTRPSWIIASVDGKRAVNRLLQVGEQETLGANRDLLLTTGDAGAVVMTVNGAAARPIGGPGQAVTVRVNSTNVKKYLAR